jgi:hypothetical protein
VTPQQALALGVRLFAVWYALVIVRELVAFLTSWRPPDDSHALGIVIGGSVVALIILFILWFFPKSIAHGLLPQSSDVPTQTSSYQMWFTLGIALIGLWFVASAIAPILRNLSVMYVFKSELTNFEDLRSLRAGLLYYVVELVLGLCLLFGATGIRKLILRIRNAAPD